MIVDNYKAVMLMGDSTARLVEKKNTDFSLNPDQVLVKVTDIDDQGRINLSRRDALVEVNGAVVEEGADEDTRPRREHNDRRDGGRERRGFRRRD